MKKKVLTSVGWIFPALFLVIILAGTGPAQALTLGKVYDKSNYQEIEKLLIPQVLNWVKKGQFVIGTKQLEFVPGYGPKFIAASKKNEGKYDIGSDNALVEKATGKPAHYWFGFPFPTLNPKGPKGAEKIMENYNAVRFHWGGDKGSQLLKWIGSGGEERRALVQGVYLYYINRDRGPIPNPENLLGRQILYVAAPFDLRGTVQMAYIHNDARPDTAFAYVPALRRVRRVSPATRSDPFLGSDLCVDDLGGWGGKNQTMSWKFLGEGTYLMPFTSEKKYPMRDMPDGSIEKVPVYVTKGYETKGFKGAAWCPVSWAWHPREVYIVEGMPKDPYYNYGKQVFYIDKQNFNIYFKVVYDKAGEYWKTVGVSYTYSVAPSGRTTQGRNTFFIAIDDRNNHASVGDQVMDEADRRSDLPYSEINESNFTEAALRALSK